MKSAVTKSFGMSLNLRQPRIGLYHYSKFFTSLREKLDFETPPKKEILDSVSKLVAPPTRHNKLKSLEKRRKSMNIKKDERLKRFEHSRNNIEKVLEKELMNTSFKILKLGNEISYNTKYREINYAPLTQAEIAFVKSVYTSEVGNVVIKGGRELLVEEFKAKSQEAILNSNPNFKAIQSELSKFQPLSRAELKFIQENFEDIYVKNKCKDLILQRGKPFYESLKKLKESQKESLTHLQSNLDKLKGNFKFSTKEQESLLDVDPKIKEMMLQPCSSVVKTVLNKLEVTENDILDSINKSYELNQVLNQHYKQENNSKGLTDNFQATLYNVSLIRGLSAARNNNLTADYYMNSNELDENGIRIFNLDTSKLQELKTIDKSYVASKKQIELAENKFVLRVTLKFKHASKPDVFHYALLDNDLILPLNSQILTNLTYPELFSFYKFNTDGWKLVDIDNSREGALRLTEHHYERFYSDILNSSWISYLDSNIIELLGEYYHIEEEVKVVKEVAKAFETVTVKQGKKEAADRKNSADKGQDKEAKKPKPTEKAEKNLLNSVCENFEIVIPPTLINQKGVVNFENSVFENKKEVFKKFNKSLEDTSRLILAMKISCLANRGFKEIERELLAIETLLAECRNGKSREEDLDKIKQKLDDISPFKVTKKSLLIVSFEIKYLTIKNIAT